MDAVLGTISFLAKATEVGAQRKLVKNPNSCRTSEHGLDIRKIYIMIENNCPECHELLQAYWTKGRKLRYECGCGWNSEPFTPEKRAIETEKTIAVHGGWFYQSFDQYGCTCTISRDFKSEQECIEEAKKDITKLSDKHEYGKCVAVIWPPNTVLKGTLITQKVNRMNLFLYGNLFETSPEQAKKREAARAIQINSRLEKAILWAQDLKWQLELNIKADSYSVIKLFDSNPTTIINPNYIKNESERVISPSGQWLYCNKILPRGSSLTTLSGYRKGSVMFDGDVIIPALHKGSNGYWNDNPFMSLTPMEMLTLRAGTKLAKGTTVIAGLGLGHQLIEASKRKQVKKLILIEQSQDLVDWLLPRIQKQMSRPIDELIVGNAYNELPKLEADVALVDIFKNYGGNGWAQNELNKTCKGIKKIWCWGMPNYLS